MKKENHYFLVFLVLIVFSILFPILVVDVKAIENPSSNYCVDNGGELDLFTGECTFPNGVSCNEWDYFCKCSDDRDSYCSSDMIQLAQGCSLSCPGEVTIECSENTDCEEDFKCEDNECVPVGCVGEGEYTPGTISPEYYFHMAYECCEGLEVLMWDTSVEGCEEPMIGGGHLCTAKCGNGVCDEGEQKCTCPEDCNDAKDDIVEDEEDSNLLLPIIIGSLGAGALLLVGVGVYFLKRRGRKTEVIMPSSQTDIQAP